VTGLDWPGMLRLALAGLRLSPEAFWRMTPAEFLLALGDADESRPMTRDGLKALTDRFPDKE
jgi:uncharacterized phage protein (TIGR02216 family)